MKRKIVLLLTVIIISSFVLASCGTSAKDVALNDLFSAVDNVVAEKENLSEVSLDTLKSFYSEIDSSLVSEYKAMRTTSGTKVDQYGVFICNDDASAKSFAGQLENGIKTIAASAANFGYTPEEQPKLDSAKVVTSGKYVMYAILSDTEREAAVTAFNSLVK